MATRSKRLRLRDCFGPPIFPGHYISAIRTEGEQQTVFTLTISRNRPMYMMEEATTAAMEEGTVEISAEALSAEIEEAGKAIL